MEFTDILIDTVIDIIIRKLTITPPTNVCTGIIEHDYDSNTYQAIAYIRVEYGDVKVSQMLSVHIKHDGKPIDVDDITYYRTLPQYNYYHKRHEENYAIPYEHHNYEGYFDIQTGVDLVIPGVSWDDYEYMDIPTYALLDLIPDEAIVQLKQVIADDVNRTINFLRRGKTERENCGA